MKRSHFHRPLYALSVVGALVLSGAALAGDGGDKVKKMDTNQDGRISAEEHATGARMKFERMDADRDGNLSGAEMKAGHQAMKHEGMKDDTSGGRMSSKAHADKLREVDSNGDGMISAEEHAAGAAQMFREKDSNGDGSVTAAEIDAAHAAKKGDR